MAIDMERRLVPVSTDRVYAPSARVGVDDPDVRAGVALCLSGGGYAGMLFTVGSLQRLNELGWLRRIDGISCVSAAAIAGAALAAAWDRLDFDVSGVARRFAQEIVKPIRRLASETIDMWSIVGGEFSERSCGDIVADAYDECLFGGVTLEQLPDCSSPGTPRFVFTALDVRSGGLVRFSRAGIGFDESGDADPLPLRLAIAIAAATAFPPMMPSVAVRSRTRGDGNGDEEEFALIDAAVYDSLALTGRASRYRTLLVSDGHGPPALGPKPESGWFPLARRLADVVRERDRALRRDWLRRVFAMSEENSDRRCGSHWYPDVEMADEHSSERSEEEQMDPDRLMAMSDSRQERWIRQGYAACDAALRRSAPLADGRTQYN